MMVTARRRGDGYALSGRKSYCAAGNAARWIAVFATLSEDRSPEGLTGFLIPTDAPGFHVSEVLPTLGLRACPLVEFYVENVRVPREHLLTPEGGGAELVRKLIARGRAQAAAVAVGIARGAYELAHRHAAGRVQGGGPILGHQMVQGALADVAIRIEAARLLAYKAALVRPAAIGAEFHGQGVRQRGRRAGGRRRRAVARRLRHDPQVGSREDLPGRQNDPDSRRYQRHLPPCGDGPRCGNPLAWRKSEGRALCPPCDASAP